MYTTGSSNSQSTIWEFWVGNWQVTHHSIWRVSTNQPCNMSGDLYVINLRFLCPIWQTVKTEPSTAEAAAWPNGSVALTTVPMWDPLYDPYTVAFHWESETSVLGFNHLQSIKIKPPTPMLELTMVTQTIMVVVHRLVDWGVPHAAWLCVPVIQHHNHNQNKPRSAFCVIYNSNRESDAGINTNRKGASFYVSSSQRE